MIYPSYDHFEIWTQRKAEYELSYRTPDHGNNFTRKEAFVFNGSGWYTKGNHKDVILVLPCRTDKDKYYFYFFFEDPRDDMETLLDLPNHKSK